MSRHCPTQLSVFVAVFTPSDILTFLANLTQAQTSEDLFFPSVSFLHGVLIVYLVMLGDKLLSLPSVAYLYFILPGFFSFSFARLR